jgi:hypothetical protein
VFGAAPMERLCTMPATPNRSLSHFDALFNIRHKTRQSAQALGLTVSLQFRPQNPLRKSRGERDFDRTCEGSLLSSSLGQRTAPINLGK